MSIYTRLALRESILGFTASTVADEVLNRAKHKVAKKFGVSKKQERNKNRRTKNARRAVVRELTRGLRGGAKTTVKNHLRSKMGRSGKTVDYSAERKAISAVGNALSRGVYDVGAAVGARAHKSFKNSRLGKTRVGKFISRNVSRIGGMSNEYSGELGQSAAIAAADKYTDNMLPSDTGRVKRTFVKAGARLAAMHASERVARAGTNAVRRVTKTINPKAQTTIDVAPEEDDTDSEDTGTGKKKRKRNNTTSTIEAYHKEADVSNVQPFIAKKVKRVMRARVVRRTGRHSKPEVMESDWWQKAKAGAKSAGSTAWDFTKPILVASAIGAGADVMSRGIRKGASWVARKINPIKKKKKKRKNTKDMTEYTDGGEKHADI